MQTLLLRQINNPVGGVDHGLLSFVGMGLVHEKEFGVASCPRIVHSHEGMNVVKQQGSTLALSNIEYCDFTARGIEDTSHVPGGNTSRFPSNTNILFANLRAVREAARQEGLSQATLNFKSGKSGARLETLMQSISDRIPFDNTFLTFSERRKTISAVKKEYVPGEPLLETPEGCLFDMMHLMHTLLCDYCKMDVPAPCSEEEFLRDGPSFTFSYHPALGPLFSVIGQKIRGGRLHPGASLICEIAELAIESLDLDGSLVVTAENVMGERDSRGVVRYSDRVGKAVLRNVHVKGQVTLDLQGSSLCIIEDVTFETDFSLVVRDGMQAVVTQQGGEIVVQEAALKNQSPLFTYKIDDVSTLLLEVASTLELG